MNDRDVDTNGIRLHYLEYGTSGPTLLLMPGLTANAHSFDGLIAAGLAERMRVLALDLRGRGLSDKPDGGYRMSDHAADVLGLMDALDLDRVVLGGHSFGGLLTYHIAASHPDRVESCVVIDAPAEVDETILDQIKPSLDRLDMVLPSRDAYLEMVKAMPYFDGWWDPAIDGYVRADVREQDDGTVRARSRPEHIRAAVEGTLEIDWPEVVASIERPLLFLRAPDPFGPPGSPPLVPEAKAHATMALLRDGRLVEIPGNHMTCLFGSSAVKAVEAIEAFVLEDR